MAGKRLAFLVLPLFVAILALSCGGSGDSEDGGNGGVNGNGNDAGTTSPPEEPTNLRLHTKTYNTIELRWRDNSDNEDGFAVYQVGTSNAVATANTNVGRAVVDGLQCGTDYQFEVRAFNEAGETYSDLLDTTTKLCDVQVVFTSLCVLDDEDPVGAGELWFWFKSAKSSGKRLPSSGTKSVESREFSIDLNILKDPFHFGTLQYADIPQCFDPKMQFNAAMRYDEPLEIYVDGWDDDDIDADDSLGTVSVVFEDFAVVTLEGNPNRDGGWEAVETSPGTFVEQWYEPLVEGFTGVETSSNEDFVVWWVVKVTGAR